MPFFNTGKEKMDLDARLNEFSHREAKTPTKRDLEELDELGGEINKAMLEREKEKMKQDAADASFREELRNKTAEEKKAIIDGIKKDWLHSDGDTSFANYLTSDPDSFKIIETIDPEELGRAVTRYKDKGFKQETVHQTSSQTIIGDKMSITSNYSERTQDV